MYLFFFIIALLLMPLIHWSTGFLMPSEKNGFG